jgi:aryl-alcohol dehydrogenase-like predicted oxidoreductase
VFESCNNVGICLELASYFEWQYCQWQRMATTHGGGARARRTPAPWPPKRRNRHARVVGEEQEQNGPRRILMEYRQLGNSGLRVSVLTLGTMTFGGRGGFAAVGDTDVAGARRQVDMCLDAGVNLIDTADVYSSGVSEEIVGEVLKNRRDAALISTKVRMPMGEGPNDAGLSRHHIISGAEASLRRLGTDHIDLYHVHEWDGQTRVEETLSALDSLVTSGKVRYLAVSNYAGWQLMKALAAADRGGYERFAAQQVYYSLEARDAEYELVPLALDQGLGILVWSPLAGGLLSGKYRRSGSPAEGTRQVSGTWHEPPVRDTEKLYDTVEALVDIASSKGASPAQVALAWLLGRPAVTSLVIGARTDEQLADNLGAASVELSGEERAALDKVSAPDLVYPHWHQAATARDRLSPADLALLDQHLG